MRENNQWVNVFAPIYNYVMMTLCNFRFSKTHHDASTLNPACDVAPGDGNRASWSMAANVDLVPGDSTGGSGNPIDGRYAQMSNIYPIITNPRECPPTTSDQYCLSTSPQFS